MRLGRLPSLRRAAAFAVAGGSLALARPVFAQGVPLVVNPPAGYPYANVANSPSPVAAPASASPASASGAPGASAVEPNVDPTSKAPNTYGSEGGPPHLEISTPVRDDSATVRIGGSYTGRITYVSLHALGQYRHDTLRLHFANDQYVSYGGVALQFLPDVTNLVHPAAGNSEALIALSHATIVVIGRDGKRASFRSEELIDAHGDPRVYLVDSRMGLPLGSYEGPFRVISPHDARASRWIRDVVEIDVNR